jgi:PKD repeat protein
VPFAVSVTNTSTGAPTSWAWTYGDGGTANVQSPGAHTYSVAGSYNITLTVTNAGGSNSVSHPVNAAAPCAAPVAIFSVSPTSGSKNSTNFVVTNSSTNMSTAGCNNIWSWNFGDGSGQSSVQSPAAYQYNKKGSYTITLTASNTGGTSTVTHDVDVSN